MDAQGHVRLLDFGMAKRLRDREKTFTVCGTPEYLAPEILMRRGHDWACDWWTLGIFLYEVLYGRPPFTSRNPSGIYDKILHSRLKFPKAIDEKAKNLIESLLVKDPEKRIGIKKIKKHEFFKDVDWKLAETKELKPSFVPMVTTLLDSSNFPYVEEIPKNLPFIENVDLFPGF